MKRIVKFLICLAIVFSLVPVNQVDASAQSEKMISIAMGELGSGYKRKYGASPWCASFVNWAARSAGISTSIIPSTASTSEMYSKLKSNGGKVVSSPQRGDLVFYKKKNGTICHVAIMTSSTMSIHGNYSNKVKHIVADSYIDANGNKTTRSRMIFVRPNYGNSGSTTNQTTSNNTTTSKPVTNTTVQKTNVSSLTVKGISNKATYTGKQIKPTITVYKGSSKVSSSNYTVTYGKNTEPGKATVTIKGKGNYTGSVTKSFTILSVDYTKLNAAKKTIPADLSVYTDDSVATLNKVLDKVNTLKKTSVQKTVDTTTTELNNAIKGLVMKTADYSCVETAKLLVPSDLGDYTEDSVTALNEALNAVVEGKLITEQQAVNDMALAIETAVNHLEINYFRTEVIVPVVGTLGLVSAGIYFYMKKRKVSAIES